MKYADILFLIIIGALVVFSVLSKSNIEVSGSTNNDATKIFLKQVKAADLPLYTELSELIDSGKMPEIQGELKQLLKTSLSGGSFDFLRHGIATFDARNVGNATIIHLIFDINSSEWDEVFYYIVDGNIYHYNEKIFDFKRHAKLISNGDVPAILYWEKAGTGNMASTMANLEIEDKKLVAKETPLTKSLTDRLDFGSSPEQETFQA